MAEEATNNPEQQQPQQGAEQALQQPAATEGNQVAQAGQEAAPAPQPARQPQQRGRGPGQRGPGQRGHGRGGRDNRDRADEGGVESAVVRIYRCSKVVKGGRTFSFGALVVAGDRQGNIGVGYGKANEVPPAVEKATKDARKSMFRVNLKGTTIPHSVTGRSGASTVVLVPARPGTGVTAGKSVRPCLELSGITDILTKAYGSTAPKNLVKATMDALRRLQSREQIESSRGVGLARGAGEVAASV